MSIAHVWRASETQGGRAERPPFSRVCRSRLRSRLGAGAGRACDRVAQGTAIPPLTPSSVDGRVMRPRNAKLAPVGGVWVTIHRVASDTAGPLDSMRVGADGRFRFRYTRDGTPDAIYFVSAMYDGIAYFSRPLTEARVSGDEATIVVFDTTSIHFPLAIKGRHIIVASPNVDGTREVVEAYEIANESDQTLVSPDDAHPSWTAPLPAGAANVQAGESDISAAAISTSGGRVRVTAPFAPGLKQLSFYVHRAAVRISAAPRRWSNPRPCSSSCSRSRRRRRAARRSSRSRPRQWNDESSSATSAPTRRRARRSRSRCRWCRWPRTRACTGTSLARLAALMLAGLAAWYARARRTSAPLVAARRAPLPDSTETLAREIASLDAEFERAQRAGRSGARCVRGAEARTEEPTRERA